MFFLKRRLTAVCEWFVFSKRLKKENNIFKWALGKIIVAKIAVLGNLSVKFKFHVYITLQNYSHIKLFWHTQEFFWFEQISLEARKLLQISRVQACEISAKCLSLLWRISVLFCFVTDRMWYWHLIFYQKRVAMNFLIVSQRVYQILGCLKFLAPKSYKPWELRQIRLEKLA